MNILAIGGAGFIGSHVARQLIAAGHNVTVFHRGRTRTPAGAAEIVGDRKHLVASADALRAAGADVVIDMTLSSGRQARELVGVVRGITRRVVVVSSGDVYRACSVFHRLDSGPLEPLPLTERSALRTNSLTYPAESLRKLQQAFGWLDDEYDKVAVEQEVLAPSDVLATVLRLPMVYGPGDPFHRLYPLIKRMDDKRPAILFEEEHAGWRCPRGYVENVAAAIVLAATNASAAGRTYNVADPDAPTEMEWAREVARVAGWNGDLVALPADRAPGHLRFPGNFAQHWVVDSSRIRAELGYREPVARDDAIRRTIEWERLNPGLVDPRLFDYAAEDQAIAPR